MKFASTANMILYANTSTGGGTAITQTNIGNAMDLYGSITYGIV